MNSLFRYRQPPRVRTCEKRCTGAVPRKTRHRNLVFEVCVLRAPPAMAAFSSVSAVFVALLFPNRNVEN
eukprot:m.369544 g.369544  ORF g.369544 m.369544 type:complete len:69 (-) comp19987_c1_seq2:106-312(-)